MDWNVSKNKRFGGISVCVMMRERIEVWNTTCTCICLSRWRERGGGGWCILAKLATYAMQTVQWQPHIYQLYSLLFVLIQLLFLSIEAIDNGSILIVCYNYFYHF